MKPTIPLTLASVAIATIGIVGLHASKPAGKPHADCACAPAPVVEPVVIERHFAEPPPPPAPEPVLVEPVQRPYPVSQD